MNKDEDKPDDDDIKDIDNYNGDDFHSAYL